MFGRRSNGVVEMKRYLLLALVVALPGFGRAQEQEQAQAQQKPNRSKSREERAAARDASTSREPSAAPVESPPRPRSRSNRCTVRVHPPDAPATRRQGEVTFSARGISDLRFDVWLLESRSSEPAEVRVYAPGDRLYKVLRVSAVPSAVSSQSNRLLSRRGLSVLSAPMPLVGTHVTSRSLYGEWRVEGWFVGDDAPCSHPVEFFLEP